MNRIFKKKNLFLCSLGLLALLTGGALVADDGTRPFLGVGLTLRSGGAHVESVVEDSPAAAAGLREGDVIVGRFHPCVGMRGFDEQFQHETLSERSQGLEKRLGEMGFFRSGRPRLGVELVSVTDELREHLGARADEGVLVGRVIEETPAEEAGVEVGDLIVALDGETVEDVGDLQHLLAERDGETFGVEVIRDGRPLSLTVSLPERDEEEIRPGRFPRFERHEHEPSDRS